MNNLNLKKKKDKVHEAFSITDKRFRELMEIHEKIAIESNSNWAEITEKIWNNNEIALEEKLCMILMHGKVWGMTEAQERIKGKTFRLEAHDFLGIIAICADLRYENNKRVHKVIRNFISPDGDRLEIDKAFEKIKDGDLVTLIIEKKK